MRTGLDPSRMSRKNITKKFIENGYYHIYNRGVDRREIFLEPDDSRMFLGIIKRYLAPTQQDESRPGFKSEKPSIVSHKQQMNLHGQVFLLAYCLMPNHFHLLVKQNNPSGITQFMRRVCTNYSMYFNKKYNRKGTLFESIYKAALIDDESQLVHLSRYIHLNPIKLRVSRFGPVATVSTASPDEYEYSSYSKYVSGERTLWCDPSQIINMFGNTQSKYVSYRSFVEDHKVDSQGVLGSLILEEEN